MICWWPMTIMGGFVVDWTFFCLFVWIWLFIGWILFLFIYLWIWVTGFGQHGGFDHCSQLVNLWDSCVGWESWMDWFHGFISWGVVVQSWRGPWLISIRVILFFTNTKLLLFLINFVVGLCIVIFIFYPYSPHP